MIYTHAGVQRFLVFKPEATSSDVDPNTYDREGIIRGDYDEFNVFSLHHELQEEHHRLFALHSFHLRSFLDYLNNRHNDDLPHLWRFMIEDSLLKKEMNEVLRELIVVRESNLTIMLPTLEEEMSNMQMMYKSDSG